MNDFIDMVSGRLKISETTARSATGGLLGHLKDRVDRDDFGQLLCAIPSSADLMPQALPAASGASEADWLIDSLAVRVFVAFGLDRLGSRTQIAGRLEDLGLDSRQISALVPMFGQFIGSKVDGRLFQRIATCVPEITASPYDA